MQVGWRNQGNHPPEKYYRSLSCQVVRDDWRRELKPLQPPATPASAAGGAVRAEPPAKLSWSATVAQHLAVNGFICPAYTRV